MGDSNKSTPLIKKAVVVVAIIMTVNLVVSLLSDETAKTNQTVLDNNSSGASSNVKIDATSVQVNSFYDGEYGYSVSIPSGNRSTCVWNWEGGNAAIPDGTTTNANTATEKHTVVHYGNSHNFKVNCFDDFGSQYVGVFPTETQTSVAPKVPISDPGKAVKQEQTTQDSTTNLGDEMSLESLSCHNQAVSVYENNYAWLTDSYTTNYNSYEDKCYLLTVSGDVKGSSFNITLRDIYNNAVVAQNVRPYSCIINGVSGCSNQQFFMFVNSKMEEELFEI